MSKITKLGLMCIFVSICLVVGCSSENDINIDGKLLVSGAINVHDNESLLIMDLFDGSIIKSDLFDHVTL